MEKTTKQIRLLRRQQKNILKKINKDRERWFGQVARQKKRVEREIAAKKL